MIDLDDIRGDRLWSRRTRRVVLASDFTTSSTSLVSVTGLSFPLEANGKYVFVADIVFQSPHTTEGISLSATSGGAADHGVQLMIPAGSGAGSAADYRYIDADDGGSVFTSSINQGVNLPAWMRGFVFSGATAGTYQIRTAAETGGLGAVTIKAGSSIHYQRVA